MLNLLNSLQVVPLNVSFSGEQEIGIVRQAILTCWPKAIQKEQACMGGQEPSSSSNFYEFKSKGRPFQVSGDKMESIACRRMAATILHDLYNSGWKVS